MLIEGQELIQKNRNLEETLRELRDKLKQNKKDTKYLKKNKTAERFFVPSPAHYLSECILTISYLKNNVVHCDKVS